MCSKGRSASARACHGEGTERPCLYGINERNYRIQRTKKKPTDLVAVKNLLYLPLIFDKITKHTEMVKSQKHLPPSGD